MVEIIPLNLIWIIPAEEKLDVIFLETTSPVFAGYVVFLFFMEEIMIKKILLLIMFNILLISSTFAVDLTGRIIDEETQEAIPSVGVYIKDMQLITYSDENGSFVFKNLPKGKYLLDFERIGYRNFQKEIDASVSEELVIILKMKPQLIEGLLVTGTRAKVRETPITFTNISNETIKENYFGQDIPMLLTGIPNVYSYSDAGNSIGASTLKVRGFDQKRIGVMINGIPLNDPEDHQVYWVDMPDFAESIQDIQFQRGVGSSLYGISTFGGSLNMKTNWINMPEKIEIFSNYGSYNTYKVGTKITKSLGDKYKINLRVSRIESDGYRDNTASELWSFFTYISRLGEKSVTELNIYGGNETTHAGWEASYEGYLKENHQHNPYEYKNTIDDFNQPHFELHHSYCIGEKSDIENTFFYIHGKGYYEQYKFERDLWEYGLTDVPDSLESDLIRQKWVTKNHYGWISQYNYNHDKGKLTIGSYLSIFNSDHWGEIKSVISSDTLDIEYESGQKYYNYTGKKIYITAYLNEQYNIFQDLNLMVNFFFQHINYKFDQHKAGNFEGTYLNSYEINYNFFNPRFGLNYNLNEDINFYGNVSFAQREPADDELYDTWEGPDDLGVAPLFTTPDTVFSNGEVKRIKWRNPRVEEEKLIDCEFGIGYISGIWDVQANLYWMNFEDEIVPYGGVDDDGNPIRGNADKTMHQGFELSVKTQLPKNLEFTGSFSYSDNYFKKFIMYEYDWDTWETIEVDYKDKKIAGFPDILANGSLCYKTKPLIVSVQFQHVGKQYLDNTENEDRRIDPFQVVNAFVIYKLSKLLGKSDIELSFRVNNIFDEEYETAGYYDSWGSVYGPAGNYYWPAAGRNIIAGVRIGF